MARPPNPGPAKARRWVTSASLPRVASWQERATFRPVDDPVWIISMNDAFFFGAMCAGLASACFAMMFSPRHPCFLSNAGAGLVGAFLAAAAVRELGIGYNSFQENLMIVAFVSSIGALAMLCVVGSLRSAR